MSPAALATLRAVKLAGRVPCFLYQGTSFPGFSLNSATALARKGLLAYEPNSDGNSASCVLTPEGEEVRAANEAAAAPPALVVTEDEVQAIRAWFAAYDHRWWGPSDDGTANSDIGFYPPQSSAYWWSTPPGLTISTAALFRRLLAAVPPLAKEGAK